MNSKQNYIDKISKKLKSLGLKLSDIIQVDFENRNRGMSVSFYLKYMATWDKYTQQITLNDLKNIHQDRVSVINYLTWIGISMKTTH